ncbi:hypothetical protein [Cytophaga aurantiaca]|uniref:hypothetical protein n=1 Tax=Cytophaga aurantiaca TaxID=29530 RepID=UPI0003689F29|nr:hypothetical protein [Cytophaga aurantiaca]
MRKFIHKITPSFILSYNERLLKNAPLGWQLQLPTITWMWLLVTLLTVPIPFFINLDNRGDDDIVAVILISVLTAVLEGFLFVYILIQFNNTKSFGRRVFINGFKEHLAYVYVFMLCMLHIIFYPLIVDIRKGNLMTDEEIRTEAITYNQAVYYFMGDSKAYRYFPSDSTFLKYEYLEGYPQYRGDYSQDDDNSNTKETYYIEYVKPKMRSYFPGESDELESKYTRDVAGVPKLYMIEDNYIPESYYDYSDHDYKPLDTLYFEKYQVKYKTDAERLKDIQNFITLYNKYSDGYVDVRFEKPDIILLNYKLNRFIPAFYETDDISANYPVTSVHGETYASTNPRQLDQYRIGEVHSTITSAKHQKWNDLLLRLIVTFHVALCLSVLLFIFKNIRLREFILMFVYTALLALAVIILTIVIWDDEGFGIHVIMIVFFTGIYFSFFNRNLQHYSSLKTVFILLSNATFAFAPLFLYLYFHEYLDIGQLPDEYQYCTNNPKICEDYYAMENLILNCAWWGGIAFYVLLGTSLYKKTYERLLALPLAK